MPKLHQPRAKALGATPPKNQSAESAPRPEQVVKLALHPSFCQNISHCLCCPEK
jgi:hypothetical protein